MTFHVHPLSPATCQTLCGGTVDEAQARVAAGPGWEAWADHTPIAAAGLVPWHRGVAVAWAVVTPAAHPHRVVILRHMVRKLRALIDTLALHRVQADVRVGHEAGYWLMKDLGFREEGVMRRYASDKADHILFALTPGDQG